MTIREVHYNSCDEVIAAADRSWKARNRNSRFSASRQEFYGTTYRSWEDLIGMASRPWKEGIKVVEAMIQELNNADLPRPKSRKRKMRWNEDGGDELDMDRLRAGHAWWRDMVREVVVGPQTITLLCNISGPWYWTIDQLLWRGATAVALCNILEEAGYRIEIIACIWAREVWHGEGLFQTCTVKRADQPADISTLVNAVSPWMYRAVWFQSFHDLSSTRAVQGHHGLYDHVVSISDPQVQSLIGSNAECVVIDGVTSQQAALNLARGVLTKLGQNSLA